MLVSRFYVCGAQAMTITSSKYTKAQAECCRDDAATTRMSGVSCLQIFTSFHLFCLTRILFVNRHTTTLFSFAAASLFPFVLIVTRDLVNELVARAACHCLSNKCQHNAHQQSHWTNIWNAKRLRQLRQQQSSTQTHALAEYEHEMQRVVSRYCSGEENAFL